jgi:hypothetical protein
MPPSTIIGVDCATVASKVGLARARLENGRWRVSDARTASPLEPPDALLARWLAETPDALLALDAPLGWPLALGEALATHAAGEALKAAPSALFSRATDLAIQQRTGKRPLEVGADRIARTAVAALSLLAALRDATGAPLPLAWDPQDVHTPSAIEVYPAGTLHQHGLPSRSYKEAGAAARAAIAGWLKSRLDVPVGLDLVQCEGHLLDALLCIAAGLDVLAGEAVAPGPDARATARREGWIWVRA